MLKIDLEKPFDHLKWFFVYRTLVFFKFTSKMTTLIMHCISSSSINVFVNESQTNYFCPSRGVRQGDPMSSYIFI